MKKEYKALKIDKKIYREALRKAKKENYPDPEAYAISQAHKRGAKK